MALTSEFKDAVYLKNMLRLRIMLKDSLLVDKSFSLFREMITYAEREKLDVWMDKTEEIEIIDSFEWNEDLMNLELTQLVNDFTKERLEYCQNIIRKIYGSSPDSSQITRKQSTGTMQQSQKGSHKRTPNRNNSYYATILNNASKIERILRRNKSQFGDQIWQYKDIDSIQLAAKKIDDACENLKSRRC